MPTTRLRTICLSMLLLTYCGACDRKDYVEVPVFPASGKLTVKGEPAYGAYVTFHPQGDVGLTKGNKPFARVNRDGTFQVTTYDTNDGAPAGTYAVTVYWPEDPEARGPSPDRLRGRYAAPESAALTAAIASPETRLPAWELD